jgi:molybdopterin molybdotransferase
LILTTGDEVVEPHEFPAAGQIRNSNGAMLKALAEEAGAEAILLATARDEGGALDRAIDAAMRRVMELSERAPALLVITGGVSVGRFDLVEEALKRRGARFHFTGVMMQPGKPVVFGEIPDGEPVGENSLLFFGLPGNPVSVAVTFRLFVEEIVGALGGVSERGPRFLIGHMESAWKGKAGLTRFLPAVCERSVGNAMELPKVRLVEWHGSGDLTAFAKANCLVVIAAEASEVAAGETVRILMR